MKKSIITLPIIIIALLALTFAGCGSNGSSDSDANQGGADVSAVKVIDIPLTQEEYAFGVDKNQPELLSEVNEFIAEIKSDGTFDQILNRYFGDGEPQAVTSGKLDSSKDQLVVATNAAFEPFEYTAGDKYYGIDMEIAALLAERLDKELVISNMDFDAVCLSVGQGKADIAMAGLTIKEDRKEYVEFSDAYYNAAQKVIVKGADTTFDNCQTAADVEEILSGLNSDTKIGIQTGTTGQFYVEGDDDWGFTGFDATSVGYKNGSLAVQDMLNGNINYVIIDEAPAQCISQRINELN
ncbi:MAG: transporter substrate-binding domain-containing protein [Bacillota bacterium]|jgi:ABC-type amino acid transport substrate-binding protein